MPEYNLIQRPELIERMRKFLGLRQKSTTPTLATTLQPVLVVGDLDRPMRLGGGLNTPTRRPFVSMITRVGVGGQQASVGYTTGAGQPFTRVFLRKVMLQGTGAAVLSAQDAWHPSPVGNPCMLTDWGTGGDFTSGPMLGRTGTCSDANGGGTGGFVSGTISGLSIPNPPNYLTFDLEGYVLTAQNTAPGAPGGQGNAYWFCLEQTVINYTITAIFFGEEEVSPALGSP